MHQLFFNILQIVKTMIRLLFQKHLTLIHIWICTLYVHAQMCLHVHPQMKMIKQNVYFVPKRLKSELVATLFSNFYHLFSHIRILDLNLKSFWKHYALRTNNRTLLFFPLAVQSESIYMYLHAILIIISLLTRFSVIFIASSHFLFQIMHNNF